MEYYICVYYLSRDTSHQVMTIIVLAFPPLRNIIATSNMPVIKYCIDMLI